MHISFDNVIISEGGLTEYNLVDTTVPSKELLMAQDLVLDTLRYIALSVFISPLT
jgi:hypothetical protein